MSSEDLRRAVMAALARIPHPGSGRDLIAGGHVQNVEVDEDGARASSSCSGPRTRRPREAGARAVESLDGSTR
jgi:hypothetical protein